MEKHTVHAYLIECLSNLHVGSGDNNYGVIDKQVQRDTISSEPVIHASSLKGAFREYLTTIFPKDENGKSHPVVIKLFGADKTSSDNPSAGELRFFEARLLTMPVRGTGPTAYYLAGTEDIFSNFEKNYKAFQPNANIQLPAPNNSTAETEHGTFPLSDNMSILNEPVAILTNTGINDLLTHLPVIARNSLENGQSENLWYEEIVPRQTRFYFFIAVPNHLAEYYRENFENRITEQVIQIGANATVGYGYCKISKI